MKRRPLSLNMRNVLVWIADGSGATFGCRSRSDHGGRHTVLVALVKRGLLTIRHTLTSAGRETVRQIREKRLTHRKENR